METSSFETLFIEQPKFYVEIDVNENNKSDNDCYFNTQIQMIDNFSPDSNTKDRIYAFQCTFCFEKFHIGPNLESRLMGHFKKLHSKPNKDEYFYEEPNKTTEESKEMKKELPNELKIEEVILSPLVFLNDDVGKAESSDHDDNCVEFICDNCDKGFTEKPLLEIHLKNHIKRYSKATTEKTFQCTKCMKFYLTQRSLDEHILLHGEPEFECKKCDKMFFTIRYLRRHLKKRHKVTETHQCNQCSRVFSCEYSLKNHINKMHKANLTMNGKRVWKCEECSKIFSQKQHLNEHVLAIHRTDRPFKCSQCSKSYIDKRRLKVHYRKQHTIDGKVEWTCNECGKSLSSKMSLEAHLRMHKGATKMYPCNICSELFASPSNVRRHQVVHTKEKPHECKICGAKFTQRGNLTYHMKNHLNIRNHTCLVCNVNFVSKSLLTKHMPTHTGEPISLNTTADLSVDH